MQALVCGGREIVCVPSVGNARKPGGETAVAVLDSVVHGPDDRLRGANQIGAAAGLCGAHAFVANDRSSRRFVGQDFVRGSQPAETNLPRAGTTWIDDFVKEDYAVRFACQRTGAQLGHARAGGGKRGGRALFKHLRG